MLYTFAERLTLMPYFKKTEQREIYHSFLTLTTAQTSLLRRSHDLRYTLHSTQ